MITPKQNKDLFPEKNCILSVTDVVSQSSEMWAAQQRCDETVLFPEPFIPGVQSRALEHVDLHCAFVNSHPRKRS